MPPTFTAPLYPDSDELWLTRFTPQLRWYTQRSPFVRSVPTALALDEPLSVIPRDVLEIFGIVVNYDLPDWTGRQEDVPPWRGMPCQIGVARIVLIDRFHQGDSGGYRTETVNVLVRVPERDPVAAPTSVLLGNEFFIHYNTHLHIHFGVLHQHLWPLPTDYNVGEFVFP